MVFPENKTCSFLNSIWLWFGRPLSSSPIIPTCLQCLSTCLKAGGKCNHFDVLFSSNILLKICMHCLKDNRDHCGKNLWTIKLYNAIVAKYVQLDIRLLYTFVYVSDGSCKILPSYMYIPFSSSKWTWFLNWHLLFQKSVSIAINDEVIIFGIGYYYYSNSSVNLAHTFSFI